MDPTSLPRATSEKIVVTISGPQSPGALVDVMYVLGTSGPVKLVDFGQLVLRGRFTATAVLAPPDSSAKKLKGKTTTLADFAENKGTTAADSADLADTDVVDIDTEVEKEGAAVSGDAKYSADAFRDIIVRAHTVGFHVEFDASSRSATTQGAYAPSASIASALSEAASETDEYVVTLFSPGRIPARFVADTTRVIAAAGANIQKINRLSDDGDQYMCLELTIALAQDEAVVQELRESLFLLGRATASSDIAMQPVRVMRMAKRIVVFDLSWTLVGCDAVDVLLEAAGLSVDEAARAAYREGTMSGVDYLLTRVSLLEGKDSDAVNAAALEGMTYTTGAKQLCKGLKRLGCRLAVVSSGSRKIAEKAKEDLGLDYYYGNVFETDATRRFTGVVSEPVIDADRKADLVQMLAMQEGVDAEQVVAVGDGPVSSKMLSVAGMSVAFDQPDSVEGVQTGRISSKSLASVFYLLGVTGRDFRELLEAS